MSCHRKPAEGSPGMLEHFGSQLPNLCFKAEACGLLGVLNSDHQAAVCVRTGLSWDCWHERVWVLWLSDQRFYYHRAIKCKGAQSPSGANCLLLWPRAAAPPATRVLQLSLSSGPSLADCSYISAKSSEIRLLGRDVFPLEKQKEESDL